MGDANASDSPLARVADGIDTGATEAFKLLGNETRLAILLALWNAYEPFAEGEWDPTKGNVVSFSKLRERVGISDPGQFNYHLGKLEGHFVERSPDGYQLLPAGNKIVRAVIASGGFTEAALPPTEVDLPCPNCTAPTAITYQNQRLYHICTECDGNYRLGDEHPSGVLGAWVGLNPAALSQRSPEESYLTTRTEVLYFFAIRAAGICPWCSGTVETNLHRCDAHAAGANEPCRACGRQSEWAARFSCTGCKHTAGSSLPELSLCHPAVIAFYWDHGIDLGGGRLDLELGRWLLTITERTDQELVSTDPLCVRVTHNRDGDQLELVYDEELNVVDVTREVFRT